MDAYGSIIVGKAIVNQGEVGAPFAADRECSADMEGGMSADGADLIKSELRTDDEFETLWANPLGGNLYRLDNTPLFAYGVSWKDVVEAVPQQGALPLFTRVVEKSGHRTVRVILQNADELERLKSGMLALGCSFEGAWSKLIGIDIPAGASLEAVRGFLVDGGYEWEHADPTYDRLPGGHGKVGARCRRTT